MREQSPEPQRSPVWRLALVIPVLAATMLLAYVASQFTTVGAALGGGASGSGSGCVTTYGLNAHNSYYFVRDRGLGVFQTGKNAPREESTVVSGMARNDCGEPLRNVRIRIKVTTDGGKTATAWATIGQLGVGQVAPFEKAWMARLASWEVIAIR